MVTCHKKAKEDPLIQAHLHWSSSVLQDILLITTLANASNPFLYVVNEKCCRKKETKQKTQEKWAWLFFQHRGFFRGMSWPLVSFGFMNSAFFGMYGHLLQLFGHNLRETAEPHFLQTFTAGFLATFPTVFLACPIDVVKVTLQSQIEHDVCPNTGNSQWTACLPQPHGQSHCSHNTGNSQWTACLPQPCGQSCCSHNTCT